MKAAALYRCRAGRYQPVWRYGETKRRPAAILAANGVYDSKHSYPKGSSVRALKIESIGFRCERLDLAAGEWIDVTKEFL